MASADQGSGSKTAAINHYDGIFKFVHEKAAQESFQRARLLLARQRWEDAVSAFRQARAQARDNANDVDTLDLILQEMARYRDNLIPDDVVPRAADWSSVCQRPVLRLEERSDRLPQGVFFLTLGPADTRRHLVGRKTLSDKWLMNRIPELFCSLIRPDMVLGQLADQRLTDHSVIVYYHPLDNAEKLQLFRDIYACEGESAELTFPFPLLKASTRKEFTSPAEGWQVDNVYDDMLSNGEAHIREYTCRYLRSLKLAKPRLYDPACSTGVFLSTLKSALPDAYTIGQDLSKQMADVSRERLDEAHHGDALEPQIQLASAQVVFIRFLNSEVVTSAQAEMLLAPLLKTVAVGGLFVVLGHTPILLSSANFRYLDNFRLERCVAVDVEKRGLFQYYVLKRMK